MFSPCFILSDIRSVALEYAVFISESIPFSDKIYVYNKIAKIYISYMQKYNIMNTKLTVCF